MSLLYLATLLLSIGADAETEPASFHHVLMNVTNVQKTMEHYERVYSATPTRFNGKADALYTERSFILFNQVEGPPRATLDTAIWHIGWGGVDVAGFYSWWKERGVKFSIPLTPLPGKDNYYLYIEGPDGETVEVNTTGHTRFGHVHLFASDVNKTCIWYEKHLGLKSRRGTKTAPPSGDPNTLAGIWMNFIQCDNVNIIVFGAPQHDPPPTWWNAAPLKEFKDTAGHVYEHIAFSYRDIEPVYERMKAADVEILKDIGIDEKYGLRSFIVCAPDNVRVAIVEAKPIPEGVWE